MSAGNNILMVRQDQLPTDEPEQLEQVVAGADQRPLRVHFLQAPQQELPEVLALLDLAEYGFHGLHA